MRTKASIKGHPLHQMLIPFPIAFLVGSLGFDIIGYITGNSSFWITAAYMCAAGIFMAFVAATPGFIDYLYSVPPNSSGKKRATKHMICNLSAVFLFLAALLVRTPVANEPGIEVFIIEIVGSGLLGAGGWLGGTLVNRNFIGPDHRYANSTKWSEINANTVTGNTVKIAGIEELKVNQMKLVRIDENRLVLAHTESGYTVFDDSCTHRGGSLADGVLICGTVQCLWHGSQFDVKTGDVKSGPARIKIKAYPVEIRADGVYITLNK